MKKLLLLTTAALLAVPCVEALGADDGKEDVKPEVMLTGIPWSVMGTSPNGRWICGTRQNSVVYRYDTWNKKLEYIWAEGNMESVAHDVADDGTVVGMDDDAKLAIWKPDATTWTLVETTNGHVGNGTAFECSGDMKMLIGYTNKEQTNDKPYNIEPTLWKLTTDGTYEETYLPVPAKDFLGGVPQFVSPRFISTDGKRVVGPVVNERGNYPISLIYTLGDDGKWTYSDELKDIKFTDKFKEIYTAEPNMDDYVTAQPGSPEYMDQVNEYIKVGEEWQKKLESEGMTGHDFSATPMMSDNGKWLVGDCTAPDDFYGPAIYDIDAHKYTELTALKGHVPYGVTNEGDIVTATEDQLMAYLVVHGHYDQPVSLVALLEEYGMNLMDYLPQETAYIDNPAISGDGKTITARYITGKDAEGNVKQEMFCIALEPVANAVRSVLNTPDDEGIAVKGDVVETAAKAATITVYGLSGRVVKEATATRSMSIGDVPAGVYVVKAKVDGRTLTTKIIKR